MNPWVEKSIELANTGGYLDSLSNIYEVGEPLKVGDFLNPKTVTKLKKIWNSGDKKQFVKELVQLSRFPYNEPYIGSLKAFEDVFKKNPATVARIIRRLNKMGFKKIIDGLNRETMPSRQLGQSFRNWSRKAFEVVSENDFFSSKGIAILDGGDESLAAFAETKLGYKREKGLDFVAIAYGTPVIGESKFISRSGGAQTGSFKEAIKFVKEPTGRAKHVAIIDGLIWASRYQNIKQLTRKKPNIFSQTLHLKKNQSAMSALLLKEYLESLKK